MSSGKPIIFISYAHRDEPERPTDGEIKWLTFVLDFLKPAVKHGLFEFWVDRHMMGGVNWDEEIERNLRTWEQVAKLFEFLPESSPNI
jgi:hypothetical protein